MWTKIDVVTTNLTTIDQSFSYQFKIATKKNHAILKISFVGFKMVSDS